jgi:Ca2+-binding RTX toxin-like protein
MTTIIGTERSDFLSGTPDSDVLSGSLGNDILFGGDGDDVLYDGAGFDVLLGGDGNDILIVFDNNRFDSASSINPIINGGNGFDVVDATDAIERIHFVSAIFTFASIEQVIGSSFADVIDGRNVEFDLSLSGGEGDDTLNTGAGNDELTGGAGGDILSGGQNSDTFIYEHLEDSLLVNFDVITDFEVGVDWIKAPVGTAADSLLVGGQVETLDQVGIAAVLTQDTFISPGVATFTYQDRTFLAINDASAGYQVSSDAVIEITGYQGDLKNLTII